MLKDILVPLDGSELSERALLYAESIIEEDGHMILMLVVEPVDVIIGPSGFAGGPALIPGVTQSEYEQEEIVKHAQDYLSQIATKINKTKIEIETIVQVGKPEDEIVDFATNSSIDAIVMSTHGRTGLSRWFMGSVTQKVLGAAPCPVFVIRNNRTE
jgi:nucleotide-binding universal stress UspA family protein